VAFAFIYGTDEYLVGKTAVERWTKLSAGCDPEWGVEIIDGRALKVEEAVECLNRFRSAAQTVGLFGGARAVWLRNLNFLAATVVGRSESVTTTLEDLKPLLEAANPDELRLLISAEGVDKRLSFPKWAIAKGNSTEVAGLDNLDEDTLARLAKPLGLNFADDAASLFIDKVGSSARAVESELEKLSLYYNSAPDKPASVEISVVRELTSPHAEGEFFEPLEAFYSRDSSWALQSVHDYFDDPTNDARPILTAFLNRNRLILMVKAALEGGVAKSGFKGLSWTSKSDALRDKMGTEKTPFNLFAQNPWYLGRLATEAKRFELKELTSIQSELADLFESVHREDPATAFERFFLKHLPAKVGA
jgi:DNA polymerase-3 subunit delta